MAVFPVVLPIIFLLHLFGYEVINGRRWEKMYVTGINRNLEANRTLWVIRIFGQKETISQIAGDTVQGGNRKGQGGQNEK